MPKRTVEQCLAEIDAMIADEGGEALYQILSGSLRGPDNGVGKQAVTMRLRRIAFPKTCARGTTGMMNCDGKPENPHSVPGVLSHYAGHTAQAIHYLTQIGRIPQKQS